MIPVKLAKTNNILYLFLNNLNDILIIKNMTKATMLWIVPCTCTPYKHVFDIFNQTPVDMIAEVLNCTATSILKLDPWSNGNKNRIKINTLINDFRREREGEAYSRKNNWI